MNIKWIIGLSSLIAWSACAAPQQPQWQIIKTKYPTSDIVVAGYNVIDFGADAEGNKDCTDAFQKALNQMKEAGGGTVFVPEGRYAFKGSLTIPVSVTLRGEWRQPTEDDATVTGTILMPSGGKDEPNGQPFITVDYCAGIKDLNIWYPYQSALRPEPYPFCLIQKGGDNATFENLTLVNPYQGIRIGPGGNELHLVRNVYGTPLKIGIEYDSTTDIGRLENIHFSPRWWSQSNLLKAPSSVKCLKKDGTGIHMLRSDWEYVANVEIDGYARGMLISEGVKGAANAQFYRLKISDCITAIEIEKTNPYGMAFTDCSFTGSKHGVLIDEKFGSTLLFSTCDFSGKEAILSNGDGNILMEQCIIVDGRVELERGALSILGSTLENKTSRIYVGEDVAGISQAGNRFSNQLSPIKSKAPDEVVHESEEELVLNKIPPYPNRTKDRFAPSREALDIVSPSGSDDTEAIQNAMNLSAANGGGIVFLPGGDYLVHGQLNVPSGVELRGIHDVPHHTMGGGSTLHIYSTNDLPTITLEANSGLRGISSNYPEQTMPVPRPYPFFIQGRGSDIYVINVNSSNPYQFMDFMTHRCDNHYIEYPSGAPLLTGIAIGGGSTNGYVGNMQLNPHYAMRVPRKNNLFKRPYNQKPVWEFQKENLDALVLGNCTGQFLYQNFVFGSLYGIHFTQQDGLTAVNCISHGHGTDGSKVGCYFEYGDGTIMMVNNELVAMSSENKTAIKLSEGFHAEATLINTMVWGSPNILAEIGNGTLTLQNLHANSHGSGLQLSKGTLNAFNLNFNQFNTHLTAAEGTECHLAGFITRGAFDSANISPVLLIERQ